MEDYNRIEEIYREKFDGFYPEPPPNAWENIQRIRSRRRIVYFTRVASAAAVIILLLSLGLFLTTGDNNPPAPEAATETVTQPPAGSSAPEVAKDAIADNDIPEPSSVSTKPDATGTKPVLRQPKRTQPVSKPATARIAAQPVNRISPLSEIQQIQLSAGSKGVLASRKETNRERSLQAEIAQAMLEAERILAQLRQNTEPVKEKTSALQQLAFNFGSGSAVPVPSSAISGSIPEGRNSRMDYMSSTIADEALFYKKTDGAQHEAPLTFLATVSYPLSKRFSIETGLSYTRLSYIIPMYLGSDKSTWESYQSNLHYIGLPIGFSAILKEFGSFNIYANQVFTVEKGLVNNYLYKNYQRNTLQEVRNYSTPVPGLQFSSTTGIGLGYNINRYLNVYGQGGVQAFLQNKTQPLSIRTEKPVWPGFQAGLRFKIK